MISPRVRPILAAQPLANGHGFQTIRVHDQGRKRKTPSEWVLDHPKDFEIKKSKFPDANGFVDVLTRRYCAVKIDVLTRKILGLMK